MTSVAALRQTRFLPLSVQKQKASSARAAVRLLATSPSSSRSSKLEAMEDLLLKNCVPCHSKDIQPMTEQAAQELLPKVEGWSFLNENGIFKLHRSWKVKSFSKGLEFFQLVADVAEAEGHHPDLHLVGWNNVKIDVWTHSVRGLTENDFILAAKISSLNWEGLLSRRVQASSKQ